MIYRLLPRASRIPSLLAVASALAIIANSSAQQAPAADAVNFNREVRPILSDNCFRCHGADEKQRQAGLRLDMRDKAIAKLDSGNTAIVPGDAAKSELIRRVTAKDAGEQMPPKEMNRRLTAGQVDTLKRWIAAVHKLFAALGLHQARTTRPADD